MGKKFENTTNELPKAKNDKVNAGNNLKTVFNLSSLSKKSSISLAGNFLTRGLQTWHLSCKMHELHMFFYLYLPRGNRCVNKCKMNENTKGLYAKKN